MDADIKPTLTPTTLTEIQERAGEQVVELPGWGDGKPFLCRLRRLSLLQMAKAGTIPNTLMSTVTELYQEGKVKSNDLSMAADTMQLMAQAAMVEPTFDAIEDAGLTLTDMQLTAIYLYAQRGPEALKPFRQDPKISQSVPDGASVENTAQRIAGNKGLLHSLLRR